MDTLTVLMAEQDSEDKDAMPEFAKQWDVLDIVGVRKSLRTRCAVFRVKSNAGGLASFCRGRFGPFLTFHHSTQKSIKKTGGNL